MKDAPAKPARAISEGKRNANRKNSRKSTGPRTARGKAYSRGNALKHGLFASDLFPVLGLPTERQQEFQEFHDRLREEHQPVGISEEFEVERIAICKWRLDRAWRYENAEISLATVKVAAKKALDRAWVTRDDETTISLLQGAEKEIETSGEISEDLKERIFAADSRFCERWPQFEQKAARLLEDHSAALAPIVPTEGFSTTQKNFLIARLTIRFAISYLENLTQNLLDSYDKLLLAQQVITNHDAVDRIVRSEAAAERSLTRALERLDQLQRRRKEREAVERPR